MSDEFAPTFSSLGLAPAVLQAVEAVGYETPSPIQAQSIPPLLAGRDLLGQAQTGTGKTAAFALPLLSRLDTSLAKPQMLVLTPTRELAIQVAEAMQTYARQLPGFHVLPIYGGQPMSAQLRQLGRGVHAVVGTPGRVLDHLRRGTLDLGRLRSMVLDEADEMLRMGFIDDVQTILEQTPAGRQVALFSATMPDQVLRIARTHLRDPVEIRIESKTQTVPTVTQRYWQVSAPHKLDALTRILEVEDFDGVIVFVRTKIATTELAEKLEARGYSAAALNGDMNQAHREQTVERLRRGGLDIVVATDVAARGLDVERISHVVNFDIPYDTEAYVHRIGRTGRAGRKGEAILFVSPREKHMLRSIERATRQPIAHLNMPTHAEIVDRRVRRFRELLDETIATQDLDFFVEFLETHASETDTPMERIAAALAYLAQQERPLVPDTPEPPPSRPERIERPDRERRERTPRPARDEAADGDAIPPVRPPRERPERPARDGDQPPPVMVTYRIEVGRNDGVQVKNIVGAIANEAGLESRNIGQIKLHDDYSTVDLPEGMPKAVFKHLQKVWVCGKQLRINPDDSAGQRPPPRKPRDAAPGRPPLKPRKPRRDE